MTEQIDFAIEMKATGKKAEVLIYDTIGPGFFTEGITAKSIREQLDGLGEIKNIDLRINSQGGQVFHATAIYNALRDHPASVTVYIDGLAASAASLIAMAGDTIRMSENAFVMIHNPQGMAFGEARELRARAQMLEKIRKSAIASYADRTGQSRNKIGEMMDAETWLSADESVEKGFADEVIENKKQPVKAELKADLSQFRNVPEGALKLAAMVANSNEVNPMSNENLNEIKPGMVVKLESGEELKTVDPNESDTNATVATNSDNPSVTLDVNADDVKAEGAAEERKRAKQIRVLCEMSKCPDKADKFIDAEFSVEETREALATLMEKKNKIIDSDDSADPGTDKQATLEAKYRQEFAEQKHIHSQLGITEDEYVEQRLIEDGHKEEPALMPGFK